MKFLSKVFLILTWIFEAFFGLFYPILLIFSSLFVKTNENNLLIEINGFIFVIIALLLGSISLLIGVILFTKKKSKKQILIFTITGISLLLLGAIGISICTMHQSGAISQKITGGDRMNILKLLFRHISPVLVPISMLFSVLFNSEYENKLLLEETKKELLSDKIETISIDHE